MGERKRFLSDIIDASEMACSLRFEDVRGCPYNKFTPQGIAVLTTVSTLLAVGSLLISL